jgi:hypothetical protein
MLRRVALVRTDVSEELSASFIRATRILAMKTIYKDCTVREAIEIELHPDIINREGGFCLSKSWKPLTSSLKLSGHDPRTLGDVVLHS